MRKIIAEKTCGKISPLPFSAMLVCGVVWASYGLLKNDASIWAPNLSAICFGGYYLSVFMRYSEGPDKTAMYNHFVGGGLIVGVVGILTVSVSRSTALQWIGLIGTVIVVVMFSGPLATIRTVVRERSTNSLPPLFTLASLCNCMLWTGLGLGISDAFIWAPNLLGLAASVVQVCLFGVYGLPTRAVKSMDGEAMVDKSLSA